MGKSEERHHQRHAKKDRAVRDLKDSIAKSQKEWREKRAAEIAAQDARQQRRVKAINQRVEQGRAKNRNVQMSRRKKGQ